MPSGGASRGVSRGGLRKDHLATEARAVEGADSGIYRRFSGSTAFDFPAQDGPFPVRQRLEDRPVPTFDRNFRSKAERDNARHQCRISLNAISHSKSFEGLACSLIDDKMPYMAIKVS